MSDWIARLHDHDPDGAWDLFVEQYRRLGNLRLAEFHDSWRELAIQPGQRITSSQHDYDLGQVAKDRTRSRVGCELGAGAIGAFRESERVLEILVDLGLEGCRDFADLRLIVGGDQRPHLGGIVARHRRQQVVADPFPNRGQRAAQDVAAVVMLGRAVDQHRFQRLEKMP